MAMCRSSEVGWERRWKDMIIAQATMERYMDRRSQERNVRSLAQWSRQSEALLSRTREPRRGLERKTGVRRAVSLEGDSLVRHRIL
jgi:hypothetical protein